MEVTRVDRWLWAVRIYPTRSAATEACRGGHVRVNQVAAKPATPVHEGDVVTAYAAKRERILEVVTVIERRVGAPIAAQCLLDRSPPVPERDTALPGFVRDPSTGRPTKRDRRQLDRLRRGDRG